MILKGFFTRMGISGKMAGLLTGLFLTGLLIPVSSPVFGQYLPTHISNQGIYLFLDELATQQVIDLQHTGPIDLPDQDMHLGNG